jgi:hypothetical protein
VRVSYTAPGCDSYSDIVVRIAPSVSSTEEYNRSAGVLSNERFIVVNNQQRSFTYKVGASVNLGLEANYGKSPYTWNFQNLPAGLVASQDGKVSGQFDQIGYYSFSASANDANGNSADCYYTFNVQPASSAGTPCPTQPPTSSRCPTATCPSSTTSRRSKNSSCKPPTPSTPPSR